MSLIYSFHILHRCVSGRVILTELSEVAMHPKITAHLHSVMQVIRMYVCVYAQGTVKSLETDVATLHGDVSDRDGVIASDFQAMREQRERITNLEMHHFVLNHKSKVRLSSCSVIRSGACDIRAILKCTESGSLQPVWVGIASRCIKILTTINDHRRFADVELLNRSPHISAVLCRSCSRPLTGMLQKWLLCMQSLSLPGQKAPRTPKRHW